ncbi:MAG: PIN domain-containing protein [Cyanobacteria bacterium P01_D01_bin.116]
MKGGQNRRTLFLDANVVFNVIQLAPNAEKLQQIMQEYDFLSLSILTIFVTYNYCNYTQINTGKDYFKQLQEVFDEADTLDLTSTIFENAKSILKGKDFEDALQVATAIHNGCDAILTSDKEMSQSYQNLIKIIYIPRSFDK